ncbi:MAG: hypothetical protein ACJ8I9_01335 [Chthoniobacterales bacterium]
MSLKSLPDLVFHRDVWLMVFQPRGILTEDRLRETLATLEEAEDAADKPFNRFTDFSKLDAVDLDFQTIFSLSLYRRLTYANRPPVKSAFYVTSEALVRIVKLHALLTNHSPLIVRMFKDLAEAATWLGVPVDKLTVAPQP